MRVDKVPISPILFIITSIAVNLAAPRASSAADQWPQFRGPGASGVVATTGLTDTWSRTENVRWKTDIPGRGWSSPIIWEDRIFVTSAVREGGLREEVKRGLYFGGNRPTPEVSHRWMVYCIDRNSGEIVWQRLAHEGMPNQGHHLKNTLASETPVTDGDRLYAYFAGAGLFCYDMDGEPVWSKRWKAFAVRNNWGTAASPVLDRDRIYIVNDNMEGSFMVALDKETGEQIWRVERDEKANWATPFIWENDQRTEIVTTGSGKVRSYDLDGALLWHCGPMSSITVPTPMAARGLLYVSSGYVNDPRSRPILAIRPGASGDISLEGEQTANESIAWSQKKAAPYIPSPIVYGDYLHVLYDRGYFACFDARTGEEIYGKQRLETTGGGFSASPWAHDGKIFCLDEAGQTSVIQAGPDFRVLRRNSLDEMCMASPAMVGKSLFIRTESKLYRIEGSP